MSRADDLWQRDRAALLEGRRGPRVVLLGKEFAGLLDLSYMLRAAGIDARIVLARTGADAVFTSLLSPAPDLFLILDHDTLYAQGRLGSFLDDERVARLAAPVLLGHDLAPPGPLPVRVGLLERPVTLDSFLEAASASLGVRVERKEPLPRRAGARAPIQPFERAGGGRLVRDDLLAELKAGRRVRVLLLEESRSLVDQLRPELDALGLDVWHATSPFGVAALPRDAPPDVVVVSLELWPGGAADLASEWARRAKFAALMPYWVLTSTLPVSKRARAALPGPLRRAPVLHKPFGGQELYDALRPMLTEATAISWRARQAAEQARSAADVEHRPMQGSSAHAPAPEDYVRPITRALARAGSWVSGHTERVGTGLEMRGLLEVYGDELKGRLLLHWLPVDPLGLPILRKWATDRFDRLWFEAELPPGGTVKLRPQRGLTAWIESFVEVEVGYRPVDDAFIIRGDPESAQIAVVVRHHLLQLQRLSIRLSIGQQKLIAMISPFSGTTDDIEAALDGLLHLWRELSLVRLGIDPAELGLA